MSTVPGKSNSPILFKTVVLGLITLLLYAGLLSRQQEIMDVVTKGHWQAMISIAIAFLFSTVHGAFTAHFWDLLGIKARPVKGA